MDECSDWRFKLQIVSSALITMGAVAFGSGFAVYVLSDTQDLTPSGFVFGGWGAIILGLMIFGLGIVIPLRFMNRKNSSVL